MIRVDVKDLKGDEILAVPVMSASDTVLVQSDTELKEEYIQKLTDQRIGYVYVKEQTGSGQIVKERKEEKEPQQKKIYRLDETTDRSREIVAGILDRHIYKHNSDLKKIGEAAENIIDSVLSDHDVLTNVTIQLGDEGLAETHDLSVALAARIEVGTALGATDGQTSHSVLEDLLEAQELDDGQVNGGVKADAALVGAKSRVVLNAVAAVDVPLVVVVLPGHAELDHALGLDHALQQSDLLILGMGVDDGLQGAQDLFHSLQELRLIGILSLGLSQNLLNVLVHCYIPPTIKFCGLNFEN